MRTWVWSMSRWMRSRIVIGFIIIAILAILFFHPTANYHIKPSAPAGSLYLLVPATSSNANLCKLLLSTAVLNYPVPVLINWGAPEAEDAYVQHLAKVWTILAYLDLLADSGKGNDLVLIVDGFDIHFQLPPEVVIHRYFQENKRANKRIEEQVGVENVKKHGFKQTVIFGHDKLCWPTDYRRPACWAVPEASDPKHAYGPYTDGSMEKNRARWLNSGTVMGPVVDVRDIFKATLDLIHENHVTDSDQFYFANVFAAQEYAKRLLEEEPFKGIDKESVDWLDLGNITRTEFSLGLDYEAVLFQTMAFFRPYLTWMKFDGKRKQHTTTEHAPQNHLSSDPYYEKVLPEDLTNARKPFYAALRTQHQRDRQAKDGVSVTQSLPSHLTWQDLKLGINVISNQIFPLLHFTGPKEFRALWWPRMWYVPYSEELLKAAAMLLKMPAEPISSKPIGGRVWWGAEMKGQRKVDLGEKGGAFSDNGTFLSWGDLCGIHEPIVFGRESERL